MTTTCRRHSWVTKVKDLYRKDELEEEYISPGIREFYQSFYIHVQTCRRCNAVRYRHEIIKKGRIEEAGNWLYTKPIPKFIQRLLGWRAAKRARPRDSRCELCGQQRRLMYHRYGEEYEERGVWVCPPCYHFIKLYERGFLPKYLELKERVVVR